LLVFKNAVLAKDSTHLRTHVHILMHELTICSREHLPFISLDLFLILALVP